MMLLKTIIRDSGAQKVRGREDLDIISICSDSRKVKKGSAFIAVKGYSTDGHNYIASALKNGASAIIYQDENALTAQLATINPENDLEAKSGKTEIIENASFVKVEDSRHAEAIIAANFYDNPSHKLTLVGITGTNGKTTTVTLLYNMFMSLGYNCGLLSTIANYVGTRRTETENTTADPITINFLMNEMVVAGCRYCFMEVSSIGMDQERVTGLKFKVGIFSNLTHDHLDYHKTFAANVPTGRLGIHCLKKTPNCQRPKLPSAPPRATAKASITINAPTPAHASPYTADNTLHALQ